MPKITEDTIRVAVRQYLESYIEETADAEGTRDSWTEKFSTLGEVVADFALYVDGMQSEPIDVQRCSTCGRLWIEHDDDDEMVSLANDSGEIDITCNRADLA